MYKKHYAEIYKLKFSNQHNDTYEYDDIDDSTTIRDEREREEHKENSIERDPESESQMFPPMSQSTGKQTSTRSLSFLNRMNYNEQIGRDRDRNNNTMISNTNTPSSSINNPISISSLRSNSYSNLNTPNSISSSSSSNESTPQYIPVNNITSKHQNISKQIFTVPVSKYTSEINKQLFEDQYQQQLDLINLDSSMYNKNYNKNKQSIANVPVTLTPIEMQMYRVHH